MHQGHGGAGDPVPLEVIPDDCIESRYRTWKISFFEYGSIWMQGATTQGKKDNRQNNDEQPVHGRQKLHGNPPKIKLYSF